jgi:glycosyltransferase involved in cell wall biosynthesis
VTVLSSDRNSGVQVARNIGIAHASTEWVVLCDYDDIWGPGYLAKLSDLLDSEPGIDFAFSNFRTLQMAKSGASGSLPYMAPSRPDDRSRAGLLAKVSPEDRTTNMRIKSWIASLTDSVGLVLNSILQRTSEGAQALGVEMRPARLSGD